MNYLFIIFTFGLISNVQAEYICENLEIPRDRIVDKEILNNNKSKTISLDLLHTWRKYKINKNNPNPTMEEERTYKNSQSILISHPSGSAPKVRRLSIVSGWKKGFSKFNHQKSPTVRSYYTVHSPSYLEPGTALRFEKKRVKTGDDKNGKPLYEREYYVQFIDCTDDAELVKKLNDDSDGLRYERFAQGSLLRDDNKNCKYDAPKKQCQFAPKCLEFASLTDFTFFSDQGFSPKENIRDYCNSKFIDEIKNNKLTEH